MNPGVLFHARDMEADSLAGARLPTTRPCGSPLLVGLWRSASQQCWIWRSLVRVHCRELDSSFAAFFMLV